MKWDILDGYHGAPRITISELEMLDTLQNQISRGRGTAKTFSFDQLKVCYLFFLLFEKKKTQIH